MLPQQSLEKLHALRLQGMAQALEEQRHQADCAHLEFEERLALLIDRQWLWKENRSLSTRLKYAQLKLQASLEDLDYRHPRGLKRAQIDIDRKVLADLAVQDKAAFAKIAAQVKASVAH